MLFADSCAKFCIVVQLAFAKVEDIRLPEQQRQAAIAKRAQPEAKAPEPAANDPAVPISAPPPPDFRELRLSRWCKFHYKHCGPALRLKIKARSA